MVTHFELHSILLVRARIQHFPEPGRLGQAAVPVRHFSLWVYIAELPAHFLLVEIVLHIFQLRVNPVPFSPTAHPLPKVFAAVALRCAAAEL